MVIQTYNLTKQYHGKGGCQDICLSISEGQVFGLLGPNGAGKSTLVKTLVGLLLPDQGEAYLLGKPLGNLEARKKIGFLPENFRYHDWITGQGLLEFHAALYKMPKEQVKKRITEVFTLVGLKGHEQQRVGTYSKGMQQRIGLACALLPDPDLLFLDEPTSALDPLGRREVREIILNLRRLGKTVFINSHLLSELEMVCDQVAFIDQGRIIACGAIHDLLLGRVELELRLGEITPALLAVLTAIDPKVKVEQTKVKISVADQAAIPGLVETIVRHGGALYELKMETGSLEELFVRLIGERRN